jgi:hypothetical protein
MSASRYFDAKFFKDVFLQRMATATTATPATIAGYADKAVELLGQRLPEQSSMRVQVAGGDLSVGDRAQVLRYEPPIDGSDPNPLDQGWTGLWTDAHDLAVAGYLSVIGIYLPGNGITLSNGLSFPPSCLVAV